MNSIRFAVANFLLALLVGCASTAAPLKNQLALAYSSAGAFVDVSANSLARGRITPDQAANALATAKKLQAALDTASVALAGCPPDPKPEQCPAFTNLFNALQPNLMELERQLREQQRSQK